MISLTKEDIIEQTKAFPFTMFEYVIIGGASLVLNDYIETTDDIDIALTEEAFEKIRNLNLIREDRIDNKEAYKVGVFHIFRNVKVPHKKAKNNICYKMYKQEDLQINK